MANEENEKLEHFRRILSSLKNLDKISCKIRAIYNMASLSDISQRYSVCNDIKNLLQPYYPDCTVLIYGSSVNGFGTHGCDLDILFLPTPDYCKLGTENEPSICDITPTMIRKNLISRTILQEMGETKQLQFILRVLRYYRNKFCQAVFIPARCPILSFEAKIGKNLKIRSDLSCRNRLVYFNTKLLKFLGSIDVRVRPLTVTLRYWAKHLGIIHTRSLSSYAFTLLVIFFLQSIDPPILPSVDFLMKASESCIVAGWEVGFISDLSQVPKSENTSTEGALLEQFFSFYWNFDFARNIVCIRTGSALPINVVHGSVDEKIKKFEISAVCIRDPFNLSHNVSLSIKGEGLFFLKSSLLIAERILSEKTKDNFELLFTDSIYKDKIENVPSLNSNDSLIYFHLDYQTIRSLCNSNNLESMWQKVVTRAVLSVLKYGLLMDCEVIDGADFIRDGLWDLDDLVTPSTEIQSSQGSKLLMSVQCTVFSRVWCTRKISNQYYDDEPYDVKNADELSNDVLRKENIITKHLLAHNPSFVSSTPLFWFFCECYRSKYPQLPCIFIVLTALTKSKEFKNLKCFLHSYLPKTVQQMLL